jgi:hypothetical protein
VIRAPVGVDNQIGDDVGPGRFDKNVDLLGVRRPARTAMMLIVSAISTRGTVTTASWMSCSSRRNAPTADPA